MRNGSISGKYISNVRVRVMAQSKSFFNDVKEELECCVCQEQFSEVNEPKILKCLHTFCKTCLEKLLRQHGGAAITCPMCRQITECPNNNTSILASNLFYKRMVEIVEAYSGQGDEGTPLCGNCEVNKPLKFHCFDCNYFLCEDCAEAHKKLKVLSGHHIKEIGKFKSNDYEDFARKANACKRHTEELRFYCGQCDICICRDCAILEHRDHKFVSFEEGLEEKKSEIGTKLKEVEANGFRLKNRQQLLKEKRVKVIKSIEQATDEVHRVAEHRINLIRQHEASVTARLVERKSEVDDSFSNQLSSITARLTEIDSSLKFTEDVFGRNNLPEILNLEGTLEQRLQQLAMPLSETAFVNICEVKYVPNNVFPSSDALGQLVTTNTEPSLSVAEGAGLKECLQGEESHFTVTTKDWEGQTTYSENDKIVVEIKAKQETKDIEPTTTDLKNGQYTVFYRAEPAGEFEVSINVNSKSIKGSPFLLKVTQKLEIPTLSGSSEDAVSPIHGKGPNGPPGGCGFSETSRRDQPSSTKDLHCDLSNGVKISLYQGDITDANVDAIVNEAVLAKEGQQINEDSRQVLSQRKKLEVGEAVYARSGNLVCDYVIHAFGPRWEQHGRDGSILLLRRACMESLRLAGRMNLRSIALPAISSGSFGVPKDVCAEVMFAAVEEFSGSVDAQCCSLRDVRFVIIDMPTIEVFRDEFVKRYLSQVKLPARSPNPSGNLDEDTTAFKTVNVGGESTMKSEKSPSVVGSKDIKGSGDALKENERKGSKGDSTRSKDKRCRNLKGSGAQRDC